MKLTMNLLHKTYLVQDLNDVINAENEVLTSTDEDIDWNAPVAEILDNLQHREEFYNVECDRRVRRKKILPV